MPQELPIRNDYTRVLPMDDPGFAEAFAILWKKQLSVYREVAQIGADEIGFYDALYSIASPEESDRICFSIEWGVYYDDAFGLLCVPWYVEILSEDEYANKKIDFVADGGIQETLYGNQEPETDA